MRQVYVGLAVVALLVLGAFLALVAPGRCPVTRSACERIERGMTVGQVEMILGGPPGDYRTFPPHDVHLNFSITTGSSLPPRRWQGDEGEAVVYFNRAGRVRSSSFDESPPRAVTLAERAAYRFKAVLRRLHP
jgi:hypothetical protein